LHNFFTKNCTEKEGISLAEGISVRKGISVREGICCKKEFVVRRNFWKGRISVREGISGGVSFKEKNRKVIVKEMKESERFCRLVWFGESPQAHSRVLQKLSSNWEAAPVCPVPGDLSFYRLLGHVSLCSHTSWAVLFLLHGVPQGVDVVDGECGDGKV